jgi:hypothetical protein
VSGTYSVLRSDLFEHSLVAANRANIFIRKTAMMQRNVIRVSQRLQVRRIYAWGVFTQMVQYVVIRDRPYEVLIESSVRFGFFPVY